MLTFEPASHTYRFDGVIVPSVTQILKATRLVDYSMIPQDVLQVAAARGTKAHTACQFLDDGELDENSLDDETHPYVESYKQWKQASGFEVAMNEQRVYCPSLRYAGTLDRTGFLGKTKAIVDFKTGIILPGHALQIAAYANCLKDPQSFRRIALKLNSDGSMATAYEFEVRDFRQDLQVFVSALTCVNWMALKGVR